MGKLLRMFIFQDRSLDSRYSDRPLTTGSVTTVTIFLMGTSPISLLPFISQLRVFLSADPFGHFDSVYFKLPHEAASIGVRFELGGLHDGVSDFPTGPAQRRGFRPWL